MRPIDIVCSRFDRLIKRAGGGWLAQCPAHEDRSPSLSLTERDDGMVLLHCFAGCSAGEVMSALGLSLSDLWPEQLNEHSKHRSGKPAHDPRDLLRILHHEAECVSLAAASMMNGEEFTDQDFDRLLQARLKIELCREAVQ